MNNTYFTRNTFTLLGDLFVKHYQEKYDIKIENFTYSIEHNDPEPPAGNARHRMKFEITRNNTTAQFDYVIYVHESYSSCCGIANIHNLGRNVDSNYKIKYAAYNFIILVLAYITTQKRGLVTNTVPKIDSYNKALRINKLLAEKFRIDTVDFRNPNTKNIVSYSLINIEDFTSNVNILRSNITTTGMTNDAYIKIIGDNPNERTANILSDSYNNFNNLYKFFQSYFK